jgi:hypothetical protein
MSSSSNSPFAAEKLRFPLPLVLILCGMLASVCVAFGVQQSQLSELRDWQRGMQATVSDVSAMRNDITWIKEYLRHGNPK